MSEAELTSDKVGKEEARMQEFKTRVTTGARAWPVTAAALISAFFLLILVSALAFSVALRRHSLYLAADEFC
jgi:hypothetical protein